MARTQRQLDFEVTRKRGPTQSGMEQALDDFSDGSRGAAE
ncbi:MAG: caspase family protein [SAR324 cluster bacterium]|nr:caspase family protein [SAR324 cluster bacterium]MCH8887949.1 caspase family protein [SAR324 cluster bacterium]